MINELLDLKNKFETIKKNGKNKSLRKSTTGLGYTFETLLNKKEDNKFLPDYKGIEIKTKLGYSKYGISLFTLTPRSNNNELAINRIYNNYSYKKDQFRSFKGNVYSKSTNIIGNKYILKTKIDYENKKIILLISDINLNLLDDTIYWTFDSIKERLYTKLQYLALIKGYPYRINNTTYYKYTNIDFYKLTNFENFIYLLENDLIYITFNISTYKSGKLKGNIHDHGTSFRIRTIALDILFDEIII